LSPPPEIPCVSSPEPETSPVEPRFVDEPEPATFGVPDPAPVSVHEPEPLSQPVQEVVVESHHDQRPEPVRQPDVTVVTSVQEPMNRPRPVVRREALDLFAWISHAADLGATTLYLRAGSPAAARIDERIQPISQETVAASVIEDVTGVFT